MKSKPRTACWAFHHTALSNGNWRLAEVGRTALLLPSLALLLGWRQPGFGATRARRSMVVVSGVVKWYRGTSDYG